MKTTKLCETGAQTCALPQFCDRDLEINPMTLKLKSDLDILKTNRHTKNKAASLTHLKLKLEFEKHTKLSQGQKLRIMLTL